ncbi:LppU/SCO3897 family protein [Actinosynnema sp. CS-041913]|uniref:LppU/SCO3897 family protein n=1 Tax=Actinosynnema sp. CS-041913 TaxID=3239917 RepID=UPI003D934003
MSNEPNQPAEDAPEPKSAEAAGQAAPAPKADADAPKAPAPAADAAKPAPAATPAGSAAKPAEGAATPAAESAEPAAEPAAAVPADAAAKPDTPAGASPAGEAQPYLIAPDDEERAEPAKAGSPTRKILIGVLGLVIVVAGFFAVRYFVGNSAAATAGDCVDLIEQPDNRADVKTLDCDDEKATYKVGKVMDKAEDVCPEEGLYTEVSPASSVGGDGYKLCLLPNMVEGACYQPDESSTGFVKGDCTGTDTFKVTQVIKDVSDLTKCPDSAGFAYPEPAVTYCLAPAEL